MVIDNCGKPPEPRGGGAAAPHRVFILSDFRLLRDGVALALQQQSSVQLVGTSDLSVPTGEVVSARPDVLLLDITLAGSLDISRAIREAMPAVKIVALAATETESVLLECAKAGVAGFVAPGGAISDVVAAMNSAMRGELVCSPRTAGLLLSHVSALAARPRHHSDNDALTQREAEIAQLVGKGLSNKQIALALGIQSPTVKNHVHSILGKLNMQRRIEIAALSSRERSTATRGYSPPMLQPNGRAAQDSLGIGPDQAI